MLENIIFIVFIPTATIGMIMQINFVASKH